jgi:putative FmdB family regulatory protein
LKMPIYDYVCPKCDDRLQDVLVTRSDQVIRCLNCESPMLKDYTNMRPSFKPDIPEHFNESLGVTVKSRRDLREKLFLTNSRTDDIDPSGGLTVEERAIRRGDKDNIPVLNKSIFDKRKQLGWGQSEMISEVDL